MVLVFLFLDICIKMVTGTIGPVGTDGYLLKIKNKMMIIMVEVVMEAMDKVEVVMEGTVKVA